MDPKEQESKSRANATKYKHAIDQRCNQLSAKAEELEIAKSMDTLRESLMEEFSDVFKKELTPQDRVNIAPVIIETTEISSSVKQRNSRSPI